MFVENLIFNGRLVGAVGGWILLGIIVTNPEGEISVEQGKHVRFINKYILVQQY